MSTETEPQGAMKNHLSLTAEERRARPTIVISSSRTGSNFFLEMVRQRFPDWMVLGEIFRPNGSGIRKNLVEATASSEEHLQLLAGKHPMRLWNSLESRFPGPGLVAKIFYYHSDDQDLWNYFRDHCQIVHLYRRNLFNCFVSKQLAQSTGKWALRSDQEFKAHGEPLELRPGQLKVFINKRRGQIEQMRSFLGNIPYQEVAYEDIEPSPAHCMATVCHLFGVTSPEQPLKSRLKRQKRQSNRELIANYEELQAFDRPMIEDLFPRPALDLR